jgi:MoxR-like ATPase
MKCSKAMAAMHGRDFVTPDDIRFVLPHVLNHRVILSPELELEGADPEEVIKQLIEKVEVPR